MRSIPAGSSFEGLSAPESLWRAYQAYSRGKRHSRRIAAFDRL